MQSLVSTLDGLFGCLLRGIVTGSPHPRISPDIAPFPLPVTFPYHNHQRALTPTQSPSSSLSEKYQPTTKRAELTLEMP